MKPLSELRKEPRGGSKYKAAPWAEIEALYCAGHSAKDICKEYEEYGITPNAIGKRSHDQQWPTPYNLRKQAKALLEQASLVERGSVEDDPAKAMAQRIAEQGLEHRGAILDITRKQLANFQDSNRNIIRSAHDLVQLDLAASRHLGLDRSDDNAGLAININGFANPPRIVTGQVVDND